MNNNQILIYKNTEGNIKIDVTLKDETVWLTQDQMTTLFGKAKSTINEHIKNIFNDGELEENSVIRKFRTTASDGKNYLNEDEMKLLGLLVEQYLAFAETMAQQQTPMYMKDWVERLDIILQLNGRELLTHAGQISHKMALSKSGEEYAKYKEEQKQLEHIQSLEEIARDIKKFR